MSTHRFTDLSTVVDEVHGLIDEWVAGHAFAPPLNEGGEIVLRLAVHEWIANLVQHAAFDGPETEIALHITSAGDAVEVDIEDTSSGFDLLGQIEAQRTVLGGPAPSERGRGLLMLITCTENLQYIPASGGRQRLTFMLRNPPDAVFDGLFYAPDPAELSPSPHGDGLADGFASPPLR